MPFLVGARVQLKGLVKAAEHNGKCGSVVGHQGERFKVKLLHEEKTLAVKEANLEEAVGEDKETSGLNLEGCLGLMGAGPTMVEVVSEASGKQGAGPTMADVVPGEIGQRAVAVDLGRVKWREKKDVTAVTKVVKEWHEAAKRKGYVLVVLGETVVDNDEMARNGGLSYLFTAKRRRPGCFGGVSLILEAARRQRDGEEKMQLKTDGAARESLDEKRAFTAAVERQLLEDAAQVTVATSFSSVVVEIKKGSPNIVLSKVPNMTPTGLAIALEIAGFLAFAVTDSGDVQFWSNTIWHHHDIYEARASFLNSMGVQTNNVKLVMAIYGLALATGCRFCPGVRNYGLDQLRRDVTDAIRHPDAPAHRDIYAVLTKYIPHSTQLERAEIKAAMRAILEPV